MECPYTGNVHEAIRDDDDDDDDDPDDEGPRPPVALPPAKQPKEPTQFNTRILMNSEDVIKFIEAWQGQPIIPPKIPGPEGPTPSPGPHPLPWDLPPYPVPEMPGVNIKIPMFGDLPPGPNPLFPGLLNPLPALLAPQLVTNPAVVKSYAPSVVAQMAMEAATKGMYDATGSVKAGQPTAGFLPPPPKTSGGYGGGAPLLEPALVASIETVVAKTMVEEAQPGWVFPSIPNWVAPAAAGAAGAGFFFNEWQKLQGLTGGSVPALP